MILKHEKFMDVCCVVVDIEEYTEIYRVEVEWVNLGQKESWILPCHTKTNTQWIEIPKSSIGQWQVCVDDSPPACLRNATWKVLKELKLVDKENLKEVLDESQTN